MRVAALVFGVMYSSSPSAGVLNTSNSGLMYVPLAAADTLMVYLQLWAAVGDMTAASTKMLVAVSVSVASVDNATSVWADFASDGSLDSGIAPHAGSGAVAAQTIVPAGAKTTLTLVFGWRMPLRNYVGCVYCLLSIMSAILC